ncbi:MAG: DUF6132 family protein [Nitrospira sp.]|nr:DUF6132 family protein [Nitrospira sp.]
MIKGLVVMKIFLGVVIGAAIGFAIGYFGKCASGTCPLTRNPWISTAVGALFGLMMVTGK